MDWYKRYMGDYMRDTANLSLAERGAYDALLDQYYVTEAPLPKDKRELYRIVRAFERWERVAVDRVLAKFFLLTDAGYTNPRADEELAKYKKAGDVSRANGSRHTSRQEPVSLPDGQQIPDTRNQINTKPKNIRAKTARFVLPDWINPQTWKDFEEMRGRIRAPLTDRARASIVARLQEMRGKPGNDPETVLLRSIERGWRGVFEVAEGGGNGVSKAAQRERRSEAALDSVFGSTAPVAAATGGGIPPRVD